MTMALLLFLMVTCDTVVYSADLWLWLLDVLVDIAMVPQAPPLAAGTVEVNKTRWT